MDGVFAKDAEDGDLTDKIKVSKVDTSTLGEKEVTYTVEDSTGNVSTLTIKLTIESVLEELDQTMYATTAVSIRSTSSAEGEKLGDGIRIPAGTGSSMKAVPRGYPTRIYPIANRQSGHHRTTSRVQVQAKVKRQRQTVTVQQIVIVTVVRTAIVQQIVRLIVFVQIVTVLLVSQQLIV